MSATEALSLEEQYELIYQAYPRHQARANGFKAFGRVQKYFVQIMADIKSREWPDDPHFVPLIASYLNGRRWEDESLKKRSNLDSEMDALTKGFR